MWVEALELQCWCSGQDRVEDRAFAVAYTHLITCFLTSLSARISPFVVLILILKR